MQTAAISAVTLALTLALPAWAQDDADPAGETATEEAAPAGDQVQDLGLDMGTPIDEGGEPQVGQQYVREIFSDWTLRCLKAPEGDVDPCQIYQLLRDSDDNPVAEISMIPLTGGQAAAGATIVAPLETLLTEQITMRVDGGTARRFQFSFCNAGGCVARVGFTDQDVNLFRAGNAATLRIVPAAAPDQEVVLELSLSGFTAAFQAALDVDQQ